MNIARSHGVVVAVFAACAVACTADKATAPTGPATGPAPSEAALAQLSRSLLTAADPVKAQQDYITGIARFYAERGTDQARRVLDSISTATFDPVSDSAALRRFTQAIAGRTFTLPSTSQSFGVASAVAVVNGSAVMTAAALTAANRPLTVIYSNGVLNNEKTAGQGLTELDRLVAEAGLPSSNATGYEVIPQYNAWWWTPPRANQFMCLLAYATRLIGGKPLDGISLLCGGDWRAVASEYFNIGAGYPAASLPEATQLAGTIAAKIRAGHKVIVVAHSWGNLLTQEALNNLAQQVSPLALRCVGVISLAPPRTEDWPDQTPSSIQHKSIFVKGDKTQDILLDLLYDLQGKTPRADRLPTNVSVGWDRWVTLTGILPALSLEVKAAADLALHSVVESYFYGDATRALIKESLTTQDLKLNQTCSDTMTVTPAASTIPVGSTVQLTATIRNPLGEEIKPTPTIAWTSNDPSVARVSSSGSTVTVTGVKAGGPVSITATGAGRTGSATISVGTPYLGTWAAYATGLGPLPAAITYVEPVENSVIYTSAILILNADGQFSFRTAGYRAGGQVPNAGDSYSEGPWSIESANPASQQWVIMLGAPTGFHYSVYVRFDGVRNEFVLTSPDFAFHK